MILNGKMCVIIMSTVAVMTKYCGHEKILFYGTPKSSGNVGQTLEWFGSVKNIVCGRSFDFRLSISAN